MLILLGFTFMLVTQNVKKRKQMFCNKKWERNIYYNYCDSCRDFNDLNKFEQILTNFDEFERILINWREKFWPNVSQCDLGKFLA